MFHRSTHRTRRATVAARLHSCQHRLIAARSGRIRRLSVVRAWIDVSCCNPHKPQHNTHQKRMSHHPEKPTIFTRIQDTHSHLATERLRHDNTARTAADELVVAAAAVVAAGLTQTLGQSLVLHCAWHEAWNYPQCVCVFHTITTRR